jgi:hypothetical protein
VSDGDGAPDGLRPNATRFDRGKVARWVAIAGVLAVALVGKSLLLPRIPSDHDVEVLFESPQDVTGLDLRWSEAGADEDIVATSLHFSAGSAPSSVLTQVHLPDGPYDVAIIVERAGRVDSTRRHITLDNTTRVTIPLR